MKKIFPLFLVMAGTLAVTNACDPTKAGTTPEVIPVTGISVTPDSYVLAEGETFTISAQISPDDATDKSIIWSSDNTGSATVDNGVVTALSTGWATVTAKTVDGGFEATCFITVTPVVPDCALPGRFSVDESGRTVRFSPGILQAKFNGTSYDWGFASTQYETTRGNPGNTTIDSQTVGAIVDLFGWSTEMTYFGISTNTDDSYYSGYFIDWAENVGKAWRTPSRDEWTYIFNRYDRDKAHFRQNVKVCGLAECVVIAPDENTTEIQASYDEAAWEQAEADGFVCFPVTGYRNKSSVDVAFGDYWSSSESGDKRAGTLTTGGFYGAYTDTPSGRHVGQAVRLVTDL